VEAKEPVAAKDGRILMDFKGRHALVYRLTR
jgi:hypothetical protein